MSQGVRGTSGVRKRMSVEAWEAVRDAVEAIDNDRTAEGRSLGGKTRGAQIANAHAFAKDEAAETLDRLAAKAREAAKDLPGNRAKSGVITASIRAGVEARYNDAMTPTTTMGAVIGMEADHDDTGMVAGDLWDEVVCEIESPRVGIIGDTHFPYHDLRKTNGVYHGAYLTAITAIRDAGCQTLIINGDGMDCFHLSFHEKLEVKRNWKWELDATKAMLKHLREFFGDNVRIVYREGNHEERFARYLAAKAKELVGTVFLQDQIGLREQGIEWLGERAKMRIGQLWCDHAHEWFGAGGVNPARNYLMKAHDNLIVNHVHRTSIHYERKPLSGATIVGASVGCLCDLRPHYARRANWNHGFAIVDLAANGAFSIQNRIILDGEVHG